MNKSLLNIAILDDEYPRHLKTIADRWGHTVLFYHHSLKAAHPGPKTEKLCEIAFGETEGGVKPAFRITDVGHRQQFIFLEKAFCGFIVR